jgi:hypothetical protein
MKIDDNQKCKSHFEELLAALNLNAKRMANYINGDRLKRMVESFQISTALKKFFFVQTFY